MFANKPHTPLNPLHPSSILHPLGDRGKHAFLYLRTDRYGPTPLSFPHPLYLRGRISRETSKESRQRSRNYALSRPQPRVRRVRI